MNARLRSVRARARWHWVFVLVFALICKNIPSVAQQEWEEPEASFIMMLGARVLRAGDTLKIKLENGNERIYINENMCGNDDEEIDVNRCFSFRLRGFIPDLNMYVIRMQYYEGHNYILLSGKTGDDEFIGGFPSFSPSLQIFSTIVHPYGGASSINVWRKKGEKFIKEWEEMPMCSDGRMAFYDIDIHFWISETAFSISNVLLRRFHSRNEGKNESKNHISKIISETGYKLEEFYPIYSKDTESWKVKLPELFINNPTGSTNWRWVSTPATCQ